MKKNITAPFFGLAFFLLVPMVCVKKTVPSNGNGSNEQTSTETSPGTQAINGELPKNWPWRGISFQSENSDTADVTYLASIGVNHIRIQLKPTIRARRDKKDPTASFWEELRWADGILDACKRNGITSLVAFNHLVLDPEKNLDDKDRIFWTNKSYTDSAFKMVEIIVSRYKNRGDELAAYEVVGEPAVQEKGKSPEVPPNLEGFYKKVLQIIRKYDQQRWFLLTPGPWGEPTNYKDFKPFNIKDPKLIYGAHMYLPNLYTHQGLKGRDKGLKYPGIVKAENWNKDLVEKKIANLKKFQDAYGYPVYVGEFQTVRWAQGADQWAKDVLQSLDKFKFSWSMFAYEAGTEAWDPFYDVVDRSKPSTQWEIKFVGKETPLWKYMISEYQKNKSAK